MASSLLFAELIQEGSCYLNSLVGTAGVMATLNILQPFMAFVSLVEFHNMVATHQLVLSGCYEHKGTLNLLHNLHSLHVLYIEIVFLQDFITQKRQHAHHQKVGHTR